MSATSLKHYNDADLASKELVNTLFSQGKIAEETMPFAIRIIHELISTGQLKGETVIDISIGSIIQHLFLATKLFKEINVVLTTDASFKHFKQWLEKDQEATDWSLTYKPATSLDGNRQDWKEKEKEVKKKIKGVYNWDDYQTRDMDSEKVPMVDSMISLWLMNVVNKTEDDFLKNIKKFTSRLKIGGQLLLFLMLDTTFFRVDNQSYPALTMDEKGAHEALIKSDFIIEKSYLQKAREDNDIADYSHMTGILARKMK